MGRLWFLLPREKTKGKFIFKNAFYWVLWQPSPVTVIFSVESFSLRASPTFQTLSESCYFISFAVQWGSINIPDFHSWRWQFQAFHSHSAPMYLNRPIRYNGPVVEFTEMNSCFHRNEVVFLVVCTSNSKVWFHPGGSATAEGLVATT